MAKPSLKDGYTRIANELLEQIIKINLSAYESRVFWAVIRLTYGWNRSKARISLGLLKELTRIPRKRISCIIKKLEARTVLLVERTKRGLVISLQKDYELWRRRAHIKYRKDVPYVPSDCCAVCRKGPIEVQEHHILPREWGGPDARGNKVDLCDICHTDVHIWLESQFSLKPQEIYDSFWDEFMRPLFRGHQKPQVSPNEGTEVSPGEGIKVSPDEGTHKRKKEKKDISSKWIPMEELEFQQKKAEALKTLFNTK